MFKWQIKRQMKKIRLEIQDVERRMYRSHSACIEALLQGKEMPAEEVKYHQKYMDQIDEKRDKLRQLEKQLQQ